MYQNYSLYLWTLIYSKNSIPPIIKVFNTNNAICVQGRHSFHILLYSLHVFAFFSRSWRCRSRISSCLHSASWTHWSNIKCATVWVLFLLFLKVSKSIAPIYLATDGYHKSLVIRIKDIVRSNKSYFQRKILIFLDFNTR